MHAPQRGHGQGRYCTRSRFELHVTSSTGSAPKHKNGLAAGTGAQSRGFALLHHTRRRHCCKNLTALYGDGPVTLLARTHQHDLGVTRGLEVIGAPRLSNPTPAHSKAILWMDRGRTWVRFRASGCTGAHGSTARSGGAPGTSSGFKSRLSTPAIHFLWGRPPSRT